MTRTLQAFYVTQMLFGSQNKFSTFKAGGLEVKR